MEDISTEDADSLYYLCKTVVEEGPQVFAPLSEERKNKNYQEEVPVYVPQWMLFKEWMMMLQPACKKLEMGGQMEKADAFSPSEVKAFIPSYLVPEHIKKNSCPC